MVAMAELRVTELEAWPGHDLSSLKCADCRAMGSQIIIKISVDSCASLKLTEKHHLAPNMGCQIQMSSDFFKLLAHKQ